MMYTATLTLRHWNFIITELEFAKRSYGNDNPKDPQLETEAANIIDQIRKQIPQTY